MCPSEVSDIERAIYEAYKDRGVIVWGIAGDRDTQAQIARFVEQIGVTFPILFDEGAAVMQQYRLNHNFGTKYPIDWVVGKEGRIIYVNDGYEPDEIRAVLDSELAR